MKTRKEVVIQQRIDEVIREEFEKMIIESGKDPLLKLIIEGKIDSLSLDEIKSYLRESKK